MSTTRAPRRKSIVSGLTLALVSVGATLATFADDRGATFEGAWSNDESNPSRSCTLSATFTRQGEDEVKVVARIRTRTTLGDGSIGDPTFGFVTTGRITEDGGLTWRADLPASGFLAAFSGGELVSIQGTYTLDAAAGRIRGEWTLGDGARGSDLLRRYASGLGWKESPLGGSPQAEATAFAELERRVGEIQDEVAGGDPVQRGFHNKGFGMRAELVVADEIPRDLAVGLFQPGKRYPAIARFSNAGSKDQHDSLLDQRGLAFRVKTGESRALLSGAVADAQDFLTTNSPVTTRDPVQFLDFVEALTLHPAKLLRVKDTYGLAESARIGAILTRGTGKPASMTSEGLWSSRAPIKWGPFAVKFALLPARTPARDDRDPEGLSLLDPVVDRLPSDHLRQDLRARLRNGDLVLDLVVQRFDSESTTPIEDGSIEWRTPWERVGQLVIPRQDLDAEQARALEVEIEKLAFSPWNCTEDFRPLGSLQRARRGVYKASAEKRGACPFGFGR